MSSSKGRIKIKVSGTERCSEKGRKQKRQRVEKLLDANERKNRQKMFPFHL